MRWARRVTAALLVAQACLVLSALLAAGCGTRVAETGNPAADEFRHVLGFTSPYYWSVEHLAVRRGMPAIDGPAQMRGKTIGCSTHSTAFDYLQKVKGVTIKPYVNETDGLADLKKGRLDAYMSQLSVLMSSISSGQPFELSGDPLYYTAASLAYKKGEQDWGALLEYAVRTLRDDGTLADTSKRWFWGFDLTKAPPRNVLVEGGAQ